MMIASFWQIVPAATEPIAVHEAEVQRDQVEVEVHLIQVPDEEDEDEDEDDEEVVAAAAAEEDEEVGTTFPPATGTVVDDA
jgi:hypothetical protein